MYLFKFLARSIGLTIPVMLRMIPIAGITFFLVGVVIYVLSPYPLAVKIVVVVFGWPVTMLLALSAVRSALTQMRETSAPDPGKVLRKTMLLTAFHFAIAALFGMLTLFVSSSLVPENWLDDSSGHFKNSDILTESTANRAPINLPTIGRPGRGGDAGPFQPAADLSELNPEGVERRESARDNDPPEREARPEPVAPEPVVEPEPEIEEEITTVVVEGEPVGVPTFGGFLAHVRSDYGHLILGNFSVQFLYWMVMAALAVPFAAQAATVAARGPAHEFLWGTGKKAVYLFILMMLANMLHFFGFLALTYFLGTSLTLAVQDLGTEPIGIAGMMQSAWLYVGGLLLLTYFIYSLMASGAAVAYVDSRVDMQKKKDAELGRILASAEQGPDIRALIRERSKGRTMAPPPPSNGSESDDENMAPLDEEKPSIRPATDADNVDDDFEPMVSSVLEEDPEQKSDALILERSDKDVLDLKLEDISRHPPLKLGEDDELENADDPASKEEPEDEEYDEDWFLKPLPSEIEASATEEESAGTGSSGSADTQTTDPDTDEQAEEGDAKGDDEEDIEWIRNLFKEEGEGR